MLYISFDKPRGFTILILPCRTVSFLAFLIIKCSFYDTVFFSRKFSLLASSELSEKKTPKTGWVPVAIWNWMGFLLWFSMHAPSHMASVLLVLISSPVTHLNSHSSFPANNKSFIYFSPTSMPSMEASFFRALAKCSIPITKRRLDNGRHCLTLWSWEKGETGPLFSSKE